MLIPISCLVSETVYTRFYVWLVYWLLHHCFMKDGFSKFWIQKRNLDQFVTLITASNKYFWQHNVSWLKIIFVKKIILWNIYFWKTWMSFFLSSHTFDRNIMSSFHIVVLKQLLKQLFKEWRLYKKQTKLQAKHPFFVFEESW